MKKALIHGETITQFGEPFPVAPPMQWVDVPDDTTTEDSWDGIQVVKYVPPPPSPEELRDEEFLALPDRMDMLDRLRDATPQQISDWVDNNVTTVAGARALFKRILFILATNIRS